MDIHSKQITSLPHTCGVYIYKNKSGVIIYVGKAIDIQKRVKQYFINSFQLSKKTNQLVVSIASIDCIKTVSEFDAFLLESKLISAHQPKYNMIAKDDKSPVYIRIPFHDELPIITLVRKAEGNIGPFQSARVAKVILSNIRKIVPFCSQNIHNGKRCFYTHLGLCNPCPSEIVTLEKSRRKALTHIYRKNIFLIKKVFEGKSIAVRLQMEKLMKTHSKNQEFEQAARLRDHIHHLDNLMQTHFDSSLYTTPSNDVEETLAKELKDLLVILSPYYPTLSKLQRIECIDISQVAGLHAVGSLVVLDCGRINTSLYRKFSIHDISHQNDLQMIQQVVKRRFKHAEWGYPDLLIVDGGKAQVSAAANILSEVEEGYIPVIGLSKRLEHIIVQDSGALKELHIPITRPGLHIILRIRDESHRFAHAYHVTKRKRAFLPGI